MSDPFLVLLAALAVVSVGVLLVAYRREQQWLVWPTKMTAATSFVAAALWLDAPATAYGTAVLVGLCWSWLGDLGLIPRQGPWFRLGLGAFLLGHVAYVVAFAVRGLDVVATAVTGLVVLVVALVVLRWLLPHVRSRSLRGPVVAYVVVISAMIATAVGTVVAQPGAGGGLLLAGALGFYLSDLSVARNRFVAPGFVNKLWGTPLYFAAQWLLALTV